MQGQHFVVPSGYPASGTVLGFRNRERPVQTPGQEVEHSGDGVAPAARLTATTQRDPKPLEVAK